MLLDLEKAQAQASDLKKNTQKKGLKAILVMRKEDSDQKVELPLCRRAS